VYYVIATERGHSTAWWEWVVVESAVEGDSQVGGGEGVGCMGRELCGRGRQAVAEFMLWGAGSAAGRCCWC
jgi:hypothetical protein